jgi:hypothetical protein
MLINMQAAVDDSKFFEAAQTLAQGLSQWDLLILGGSLVIVVSTSYYRPRNRKIRAAYFLFVPTWFCLALSVYQGISVQRSYVAYLVSTRGTPQPKLLNTIAEDMTNATRTQIRSLEIALLFTGAWLIIYIVWWVFTKQTKGDSSC